MIEVKAGYKQTEVGVIPEDWEVKKLGEIGSFSKGQGVRKDQSQSGDLPCIRYGELYTRHNNYIKQYHSFISKKIATTAKKMVVGDILFAGSGETKEEIGKCAAFIDSIDAYAGGDIVILSPHSTDSLFLGYLLNSPIAVKQKASKGQGDAVVHISASNLKDVQIPLSKDKSEQTAIATILSDTDALIERLEKLITKKIAIKQGTMQQLLTGKKRLTGFSGEWDVKNLEEIIVCLDNLRVPLNDEQRSKIKGDYPYCGANGVLDYVNDYVIDDDIILIAEDGGYFDEYAYRPIAYRMYGKSWVNNHAHILKAKEHVDQNFIYYSLVHKNILSFLASGTRAKLNKSEMYKIEMNISKDKNEQSAIATILSDMDSEIEALEQTRDKYTMIKQGMMQQLLTGRIRIHGTN